MSTDLNTSQHPKYIYQPTLRAVPTDWDDDRADDVPPHCLGRRRPNAAPLPPWPDKYPPRPYLCDAVAKCIPALDAGARGILHLPTGVGKTVAVARIMQHYHHQNLSSLFLVHRKELVDQTLAKLREFGLDPAVEQAGCRAPRDARVVVASVLSLQGRRLWDWPSDAFDRLFTDECHHAEAPSYQKIYHHFAGAAHLGCSATLDRYDQRSLLRTYPDGILYSYSLLDAVLDGYLVHPKAVQIQ